MIVPTDLNMARVAQAANHLDAVLSARGLPLLTDAQVDALWCDDLTGTFDMLAEMEACHALDVGPVREVLNDLLPPHVRRHVFEGGIA